MKTGHTWLLMCLMCLGVWVFPAQAQFPVEFSQVIAPPSEAPASPEPSAKAQEKSTQPSASPTAEPEKVDVQLSSDYQKTKDLVETLVKNAVITQKKFLFSREELGFGGQTFYRFWQELQSVPEQVQNRIQSNYQRYGPLGFWLGVLGSLCVLLGVIYLDRRAFAAVFWFKKQLPPNFPDKYWLLLKNIAQLLTRLSTPLLLAALLFLLRGFLNLQLWSTVLLQWILVFGVYRVISHFLNTLLQLLKKSSLYPRPSQHLYWTSKIFLIYACVIMGVLFSLQTFGYAGEVLALFTYIFNATVLCFLFYLSTYRKLIFDLFIHTDPAEGEEPAIGLIKHFYTFFIYCSLVLAVLWMAGYHYFVQLFFFKVWGSIGLLMLAIGFHRGIRFLLVQLVSETDEHSRLTERISKGALLVESVTLFYAFVSLLGITDLVFNTLGTPLVYVAKHPISLLSLVNGVLLLLFFWFITQIILAFLEEKFYPARSFDTGVHQIINTLSFYTIMGVGLVISLNIIGIDLSSLTIFAGALAFGVGFGLQGIAKNFASGLILIFTGLVKKGDYITVDENTGYIKQVSWKNVHITTTDRVDLIVPTVNLMESTIINWTYSGNVIRVHIPIGVSYNADVDAVKEALLKAADKHDMILSMPQPEVWLVEFGDNSINFELLVWIDYEKITVERLKGEINFEIWRALKEADIEIPFPQRDIHIRSSIPFPPEKEPPTSQNA